MTQSLLPEPVQSYEDSNGKPLNGGQLFTYEAGTLTPKATYQDADGTTPNTNPIILNERGEATVYGSGIYRMILKNSVGATIWDRDDVEAPGSAVDTAIAQLRADLANTNDPALGDHMVGVKQVLAGSASRTQHDKNRDYVSVKDFGAVGDNTTNDTVAMKAAFAAAAASCKALYIPAGTYLVKEALSSPNSALGLFGEGMGVSNIRWASDSTSWGISITMNSDTQPVTVRDIGLFTDGTVGTALTIDTTGEIITIGSDDFIWNRGSPRYLVENVWVKGTSDESTQGWDIGFNGIKSLHGVIDGFHCQGRLTVGTPNRPASTYGILFGGDTGHPVEFLVKNSWVFNTKNAVYASRCEGVFVHNCNLIGNDNGVVFDDNLGRPQLCLTDSHVSSYVCDVLGNNVGDCYVAGCMLGQVLDTNVPTTGIQIGGSGSGYFILQGNVFEKSGTAVQPFHGIKIASGVWGLITGNNFRSVNIAVALDATCTDTTVAADNVFASTTTDIVDDGVRNKIPLMTCTVVLAASQALSAGVAATISWATADNQTGHFFSAGAPTRLTVPVKGNYKLSANVMWDTAASGTKDMFIIKNGTHTYRLPWANATVTTALARFSLASAEIPCVPGDYFELRCQSSNNDNVRADTATWLSIERVGG